MQGYLAHKKQDPTVALCVGTYGGPMGVGVSYERGTPLAKWKGHQDAHVHRVSRGHGQVTLFDALRGYVAHKKQYLPRALQYDHAYGPTAALGGGQFLMSEVPL